MLPGTRVKAVRACARSFLDRFGISDLCFVAALRSARRNFLTLGFSEILARPFSGSRIGMCSYNLDVWLVPSPASPTPAVPEPRGYLVQNVHLHKKGRGVGVPYFRCLLSASRRYNARPAT